MKKHSTKKALLLSVFSLVICFSMLIGTTFAWFTDSVTSGRNTIMAGNLDVELYYSVLEDGRWTDYEKVTSETDIFGYELWEPGYTAVAKFKVVNEGSLALKYQLTADVYNETPGVNKDGETFNLSQYLLYGVTEELDALNDRTTASAVAQTEFKSFEIKALSLEKGESAEVGMVITMPTTVGNVANHNGTDIPSIEFGINLVATQYTSESDSFNNQYDKYADFDKPWDGVSKTTPVADENGVYHITNAAELVGLMDVTGNSIYIGETIVLDNNIDLAGKTVKGIGSDVTNFAGTFDGQGFTISNFKIDATNRDYYAGLFNQVANVGTVKNLTVKNATVVGNSMVGAVASSADGNSVIDNCKAIDCTVIGVKKVGAVVGYSAGSTVTNNYAENCNVFYSEKEAGAVLGFENIDSTVKNNTYKYVTVVKGASVSTADELEHALFWLDDGSVALVSGTINVTEPANQGNYGVMATMGVNFVSANGGTIKDTTNSDSGIFVGGNVTLIEGLTVESNSKKAFHIQGNKKELTIRDVTINNADDCAVYLQGATNIILENVTATAGGIADNAGAAQGVIFATKNLDPNQTASTVTIKSGTYTANEDGAAVVWSFYNSVVTIEGGTFTGLLKTADGGQIVIKGGTFSVDPTAYLADGYVATENNGIWTVSAE